MPKVFYNGSIDRKLSRPDRQADFRLGQLPDGTTVVSEAPPKETGRRKQRAKQKRSARQWSSRHIGATRKDMQH